MQLIPEYDPNKYSSPKLVEKIMDIKGTNDHYSASYLDTYSSLMDPQSSDEDEDEDYPEPKQQSPSKPKIIVLSNRPRSAPKDTDNNDDDDDSNRMMRIMTTMMIMITTIN